MAQQTPTEWLAEKWATQGTLHSSDLEQAKKMEKEQIIKAYKDYHDLGHIYGIDTEQYYKEQYKK